MSDASKNRSAEFLKIADQFRLGSLTTESSHPVTAHLSATAETDVVAALGLLFQVDEDVLRTYEEFARSDAPLQITKTLVESLLAGGRIFFTGCGSTGRLSIQLVSIWRDFWQQQLAQSEKLESSASAGEMEDRALAVMSFRHPTFPHSLVPFDALVRFAVRCRPIGGRGEPRFFLSGGPEWAGSCT